MPNPSPIIRYPYTMPSMVANVAGGAPARIPYGGAAGGVVFVTAKDAGATTLTWHAAFEPGGTLYPAADAAGNALTVTILAGRAYEIPGALYGAMEIVPVTNSATATIVVNLKS